MAEYYSGVEGDIEKFLASAGVGTSRTDVITPTDLEAAQAQTDDEIDDLLSSVMLTPVQKVVDKSGTSVYPGLIRELAKKRLAALLVSQYFGQVEPNLSALAITWKTQSDETLGRLQRREIIIRNQTYFHQSRFIPPEVAPKMPPGPAPAGGI